MRRLKIILVDNNDSFRSTLKYLLVKEYSAKIIGEAHNADEFWKIKEYHRADIIFMDLVIPETDSIQLTRKILAGYPKLRIIAITLHLDDVNLLTLIAAGFSGCIFKNNLFYEIESAIHSIIKEEGYFPNDFSLFT
jgi:DNA-binding NarL/FixJ family response regulator